MRQITDKDKNNPDSFFYHWEKKPNHRGYIPDLIRGMEIGEIKKIDGFRFYSTAHQSARNVGAKISLRRVDGEDSFLIKRVK